MIMYDKDDVRNIIEDFLAVYLRLNCVDLSIELIEELNEILFRYGIEVKHIESNR